MDSLADRLKIKDLQKNSLEIDKIRRNARNWRLLDCSIETLTRMRHAVIREINRIEQALHLENLQFIEFIDNARPLKAEVTRESIERLSENWEELSQHLRDIENAILENQLQERLIKIFGGRRLYFLFEGIVFIAILAVIGIVLFELTVPLSQGNLVLVLRIETYISLFLLAEFFFRMSVSPNKSWYFRRFWIDFVASLPLSILHFGRLIRVTRFVRLLRLLRLGSTLRTVTYVFRGLDKLAQTFQLNLLKRSLFITTLLLLFGAFSISTLEVPFNSDFQQWRESFWWSFTTVVTGGFADLHNPETILGRVITMGLVLVGFVITGIFTASLTSVLIGDDSSRIERNQHTLEKEISTIQQKIDLLSGETNRGLIALEMVAQSLSNQPSKAALAQVLVHAMLEHFETMHASVHLFDKDANILKTIFQEGNERVHYPDEINIDHSLLGRTLAALLEIDNPASLDIEPVTEAYYELSGIRMICPLVANRTVVGALQVILPEEHGRFYLYNRAPQTLAHHAAVAFYLIQRQGG